MFFPSRSIPVQEFSSGFISTWRYGVGRRRRDMDVDHVDDFSLFFWTPLFAVRKEIEFFSGVRKERKNQIKIQSSGQISNFQVQMKNNMKNHRRVLEWSGNM